MTRAIPRRRRGGRALGAALALSLTGCAGIGGGDVGNPLTAEQRLLQDGLQALSAGDYESAQAAFAELGMTDAYACESHYGLILAGIQDTAERLDTLVDSAALLVGAAPSFRPAQADLLTILQNLLEPFEPFFAQLIEGTTFVIDHGCELRLDDGFPVEIGDPTSLLYFRARFGYEFDGAAARMIQAAFLASQVAVRFLLAHDLDVPLSELSDRLVAVAEAFRGAQAIEVHGSAVTVPTYLGAVRALGALPAANPGFLSLDDTARMRQLDDDLELLFRTLYRRIGAQETGLVPQLEAEAATDPDPTDNILGLVDRNHNGQLDEGDSIVLGVRELHLTGVFSEPIVEGLYLNLERGLGDIDAIVDALHEIVQVLGDQMAAVDDAGVPARRLGLQEINTLLDAVLVLRTFATPLPEAVEFDFGAYFDGLVGVRALLPYWHDDDDDPATPDVFLIEGEGWLTSDHEPYLSFGDAPHFAGTVTFRDGGTTRVLDDLVLPADGIAPPESSVLVPYPIPYLATQDASLNGVLYLDLNALPVAPEGAAGFAPADRYGFNKAINAYLNFVLDHWGRP